MLKKDFTSTPATYLVCIHSDCPLAATCLHQMAYAEKVKTDERLHLINPTLCAKDASCKYHRDCKPVRYARGFTNFQKRMYPDQYSDFMALCVAHWPRNQYFERRRGDRPLSPNEQQFILKTLKQVGVTEDFEFDSYEPIINWYD